MTTFNAGRSAWKLNQTQIISQGKIPILQCKGRGWPGYRSCRMEARKGCSEEAGGAAGTPGLPLFPLCVSREFSKLGLHPFAVSLLSWHKPKSHLKSGGRKKFFKKINKKNKSRHVGILRGSEILRALPKLGKVLSDNNLNHLQTRGKLQSH